MRKKEFFEQWLKENHYCELFNSEIENGDWHEDYPDFELENPDELAIYFIYNAFLWADSDAGVEFWESVNKQWEKALKEQFEQEQVQKYDIKRLKELATEWNIKIKQLSQLYQTLNTYNYIQKLTLDTMDIVCFRLQMLKDDSDQDTANMVTKNFDNTAVLIDVPAWLKESTNTESYIKRAGAYEWEDFEELLNYAIYLYAEDIAEEFLDLLLDQIEEETE